MKKSKDIYKKLARNGFYIILFLCITAIGISGYVLFSGGMQDLDEFSNSWDIGLTPPAENEYDFESVLKQTPLIIPEDTRLESKDSDDKPEQKAKPVSKAQPEPVPESETYAEPASKEVTATDEPIRFVSSLSGRIDVPFSCDELIKSKTFGDWRTHLGVDIIAEEGTQVRAIADGVVTNVYEDEMMGHTVIIRHNSEYTSVYCNLMKGIVVKIDQEVKAGDVIGGVGSSSLAECMEEPHLHLEVRKNEIPIDPMSVIFG